MPRVDGPFKVLEGVNGNDYKVSLLGNYGVSASFNVVDLSPYLEDKHLVNLRDNSFQREEDDGDQAMVQVSTPENSLGNTSSSINP